MVQKEREIFKRSSLKKSNFLISAKYKATLMELRATYVALYKVQEGQYSYEGLQPVVKMSAAELAREMGVAANNVYRTMSSIADQMSGRVLGYKNDDEQEFHFMAFITNADYERGEFKVLFNKDADKVIRNKDGNFTLLDRDIMMKFGSAYSFRLYELLRQKCFYPAYYRGVKNGIFLITKNVSELKLDMGVVNVEDKDVKKELTDNHSVDYDEVLSKVKKKSKIQSYDIWANFKARCLDPAIEEVNEKTDIEVSYVPLRSGRGGSIKDLEFTVRLKDFKVQIDEDDEDKRMQFMYDAGLDLRPYGITNAKDVRAIGEACGYDLIKLLDALNVLEEEHKTPDNLIGWLIEAVRNGYKVEGDLSRKVMICCEDDLSGLVITKA